MQIPSCLCSVTVTNYKWTLRYSFTSCATPIIQNLHSGWQDTKKKWQGSMYLLPQLCAVMVPDCRCDDASKDKQMRACCRAVHDNLHCCHAGHSPPTETYLWVFQSESSLCLWCPHRRAACTVPHFTASTLKHATVILSSFRFLIVPKSVSTWSIIYLILWDGVHGVSFACLKCAFIIW